MLIYCANLLLTFHCYLNVMVSLITCLILKFSPRVFFLLFMSCLVSCSSVSRVLISPQCFSRFSVRLFLSCLSWIPVLFPHISPVRIIYLPVFLLHFCIFVVLVFSVCCLPSPAIWPLILDRLYINKTRICSITCLSVCLTSGSLFCLKYNIQRWREFTSENEFTPERRWDFSTMSP